jgi:hypothetical protein
MRLSPKRIAAEEPDGDRHITSIHYEKDWHTKTTTPPRPTAYWQSSLCQRERKIKLPGSGKPCHKTRRECGREIYFPASPGSALWQSDWEWFVLKNSWGNQNFKHISSQQSFVNEASNHKRGF